ncbi:S-layer homology domain-containing protein [Chengkuizengella axinellae]|uniref:S-layer homology domain-containing protein n=1 Tax=Chengkuizengella axinellae TaxID=3064388 RepID=A0ABT9IZ36_9BACL|nr:S-layer homology domain-containing protein [Chengkuizengella sp. 2205SS18-9]MDP5274631.1 S-layer homology domain-containing protein [Chengkuizengella sp. 2205SS18-9]
MRKTSSHDSISQDSNLNNHTKKQHPGGDIKVMKKSLSLLVAIAMVFSMFASVASAEEMTTEEKFNELKELEIFDGYEDGLPHLEDNMTREQAAKIIALVFLLDLDESAESTFSDVASDRWSTKYIEAAVDAGIIDGMGDGTFDPTANVTIEQFVKMLAEGYAFFTGTTLDEEATVDTENISAWAQHYVAAALEQGLVAEQEDYTVDADRYILVEGAYTTHNNVQAFIDQNAELNVRSVTSDNLREITVEFNAQLDEETAEDAGNYDLSDSADVDKAEVQEDGSTVVLTVSDVENQTTYTLEIDGVMSVGGSTLADYSTEINVFDADLPEVEGIEFTGPESFVVTFTEPVQTADKENVTVKEGSKSLSVKSAVVDENNENEVNVELYSKFDDGDDYEVSINNVKDFAGYSNVSYKETHTYEENTDAPTATVVDADQQVVEVEFDKPVSGLSVNHFFHTYSSWEAAGIYTDSALQNAVTADDKVTTVFVKFDEDHALPSGDVEFTIMGDYDGDEITDNWGNVFEETTYVLNVSVDREAPTVTGVEVESGTEIEVTFSEAIGNLEDGTYTLLDEDGEEADVKITVAPATDKESVTLELDEDQQGNSFVLEISDLVDDTLYENEMEKYSTELTIDDSSFAGLNRVEINDDMLYVIFDEEVTDSALDIDNYRYGNEKFEGELEFFGNDKTVAIELTDAEVTAITTAMATQDGIKLYASNIVDVNGNELDEFQISATITEPVGAVAEDIEMISKNEITVQFNQELTDVEQEDFTVIQGDVIVIDGVEIDYNDDGTLVTLTLENDIVGTTGEGVTVAFVDADEDASTANAFGKAPVAFDGSDAEHPVRTVADAIAPEIAVDAEEVEQITVDGNNVVIEFTELIDDSSVNKRDFTIDGEQPTNAYVVDENTVVLVASEDTEDLYGEITIAEDILEDEEGNKFEGADDVAAIPAN